MDIANLGVRAMVIAGVIATLTVGCAFADEATERQQIEEGARAAQEAPEIKLEHARREFSFKNHSFEIMPMENSTLMELAPPMGKIFVFKGPKRADSTNGVISVSMIVSGEGEAAPSQDALTEAMLRPYRTHLSDFSQQAKTIVSNKIDYRGATFAGAQGGVPVKGILLGTLKNGTLFMFFAQDRTEHFDQLEKELMKMLSKCTLK